MQIVETLSDGRFFVPMAAVVAKPALADILKRMGNYWRYSLNLDGWIGPYPPTS